MTETEKKALALLNECAGQEVYGGWGTFDPNQSPCTRALCRAVEQHEAFRQEVSDTVVAFRNEWVQATPSRQWFQAKFTRFIIAKPDPLVDAMNESLDRLGAFDAEEADNLRAAIKARGGRIVWEGE